MANAGSLLLSPKMLACQSGSRQVSFGNSDFLHSSAPYRLGGRMMETASSPRKLIVTCVSASTV